jgi:hypothetical protein
MFCIATGAIPCGMYVLHKCDNPRCINPEHLFLGDHDENMRDKARKGRASRLLGEQHPMAKLTAEQVEKIRADARVSRLIAPEYGISSRQVRGIKSGRAWKEEKSKISKAA